MIDTETAPLLDRILSHATERFLREGFHRVTMDDLAHDLGISKRTLYEAHPGGKSPLVKHVVVGKVEAISKDVRQLVEDNSLNFTEKLTSFFELVGKNTSQVSNQFISDLQRFEPEHHALMMQARQENVHRYFTSLISQGKESGEVRPEVDPILTAEIFLRAIEGLTRPEVMERLGIGPREAFRNTLSVVMHGVLHNPPANAPANAETLPVELL